MFRSTKMLIVLAILVSLACALPCAAQSWDFKNEFSTIGKTTGELVNPNGDWRYGWAANANPFINYTFNPFTGFGVSRGAGMTSFPWDLNNTWVVWSPSSTNAEVPAIYFNNKAAADNRNATATQIASKEIAVFPGLSADKRKTIVRWTAPGTGYYSVNATFTRYTADGPGANNWDNDVYVIRNASSVLANTSVGGTQPNVYTFNEPSLSLNAGDTLDFVVGYGTVPTTSSHACNLGIAITSAETAGTVSGKVTAATGGAAIAGAKVTAAGGNRSTITEADGTYSLTLMPGANTLTISKPGYVTQTISVNSPSADNDAQLVSCGTVTGTVTAGGLPVNRAKVSVTGGSEFTYTAVDGTYSLHLPAGTYNLTASKDQFSSDNVTGVSVTAGGTTIQHFAITLNAGASWPAHTGFPIENPNDNWTYGNAPDATPFVGYTFTAYTRYFVGSTSAWFGADNSLVALTGGPYANKTGWPFGDNWIVQRPSAGNKSIVRFTAPVAGWYTISAAWIGGWTANPAYVMDWAVVQDASKVLMSGSGVGGISPNLYTSVELEQGGTIDFAIGDGDNGLINDYTELMATISYGVSAAEGWVRDSDGNGIAGALVEVVGSSDAVYTDSSGKYMLPTSPGSHTIRVTKPGYETATSPVTISSGVITPLNFTLQDGGIFSGRILGKPAPGIAIDGARLESSDGNYSMITGTDGSFSDQVTSGTYTFKVYKLGYLPEFIEVTIPATGLNQDIMMTQGWDLAGDFSSTTSQNGPWTLAYDNGTFTPMTDFRNGWGAPNTHSWIGAATTVGSAGAWVYNPTWMELGKEHVYRALRESMKVITHPARQFPYGIADDPDPNKRGNTIYAGRKTVARFVAPASGFFDVDIKWTAVTDNDTAYKYDHGGGLRVESVNGTTSNVEYRKNGELIHSGQLNGYVGTPSQNYTDSFGTCPVIAYSESLGLLAGDVLDVVVSGDNSGWTGVDFTVSAQGAAVISGVVTSDKPGNPAVVDAVVTASKPGSDSYVVNTDTTGRYTMLVSPGTYEVSVVRPGYTNIGGGHASDVVAVADQLTVQDFSLRFDGVWDAAVDFSSVYPIVGEWSYGWSTHSSGRTEFTLYDQMHPAIGNYDYVNYKFWTTNGGNRWSGGIRKNDNSIMSVIAIPWAYGTEQQTWYSEPNQLVMWAGGAPVGGNIDKLTVLRWTAPKQMVANVNATWKSQWAPGYITPTEGSSRIALEPVVVKNGTVISAPQLGGFIGRGVNDFTDSSVEGSCRPSESFSSPILVNAGDTIDFSHKTHTFQPYLLGIDIQISEFNGQYAIVNSISEIKAQEDGTVVFLNTPMQLACGTYHTGANQKGSFGLQYGTGLREVSWFIQSDDRTQGIKCIVPAGGLPNLGVNNKVTLTGTVDTDEFGEKVILVGSINSYTASEEPTPLGKTTKSLTCSGTLVRVWGRITELVENPNPVINPENDTKDYLYEYITINDGGQPVKILMHVQGEKMSDFDQWVRDLSVGDYLGVTGIAYTIGNGEVVVMPRTATDINFYADN